MISFALKHFWRKFWKLQNKNVRKSIILEAQLSVKLRLWQGRRDPSAQQGASRLQVDPWLTFGFSYGYFPILIWMCFVCFFVWYSSWPLGVGHIGLALLIWVATPMQGSWASFGPAWHVRKTEITWLPVNNFKPHLIPLYWSSGIGPRGAIFLIRAALSSIIVQCTLMKKK